LPYHGNKLFLYIVSTIAVNFDFYRVCLSFSTTACTRIHYYSLIAPAVTSIIASWWHPASIEDPAYIRDPASIGDPASIRTTDLHPRLVLETRLLFETWLLLEVLWYAYAHDLSLFNVDFRSIIFSNSV